MFDPTEKTRVLGRSRDWERWAAATGIVFVVLAFLGFALAPNPPDPSASNDEVVAYFVENDTAIRWQSLLFAFGGVALLWFAGTLASLLRRRLDTADDAGRTGWLRDSAGRWPAIVLASAATAVALYTAGTATYSAFAARAGDELDASSGRALFELGGALVTFTSFPALVFVGAASLAAARARVLPDWLSWLGAVVVALLVIDAIGAAVGDSGTFGPGGAVGILAFVGFLFWVLLASGLLTWLGAGARDARSAAERDRADA